jgi:hypothetical protein
MRLVTLRALVPGLVSSVGLAVSLGVACLGCEPTSVVDAGSDAPPRMRDAGGDAPAPTATGVFPDHPSSLPFDYTRPDVGEPVTEAELQAATDQYLALLARTAWFDQIERRAHGWPESDPEGHYWYATWWSGVGIEVTGGELTYRHVDDGADNNGLRTPQILEGACYAYRLWGNDQDQHLVRRLMRGLSSWHLAMRRSATDPERGLLSRAAYPTNVRDEARGIFIDYSASRPGVDAEPSEYVHLPDNPDWPDLYVKNRRSKDDMGHLLRTVALMDACGGHFTEAGAEEDLAEMRRLYTEWAQRVEGDAFRIATIDPSGDVVIPSLDLARYFIEGGIECHASIAIRSLARNDHGGVTCLMPTGAIGDPADGLNNSAVQIVRTHHEAAAGLALVTDQPALARTMIEGLGTRLTGIFDRYDAGDMPDTARFGDVAQLVLESLALGVPLTSREVRWLHARIAQADASYDTTRPEWRVFDATPPEGAYVFEPGGAGIDFKDLALPLADCIAPFRNPTSRPVLDCDRVRAFVR